MKDAKQKSSLALNFKSYALAIVAHVLLLGVIFNLFWSSTATIKTGGAQVRPIQAQVIDETLLNQELEKVKRRKQQTIQEEIDKKKALEDLEKQALLKEKEIKDLENEKKRKQEQAQEQAIKTKKLEQKRKAEEEKTKKTQEKLLIEQAKLEALKLEQEKKVAAHKEEQKKQQDEKEKAQKLEKLKLEKDRQELAQKKEQEAADRQRAKIAEDKRRKQADLEAQLAQETAEREAATLFAQYIGPIANKVANSWIQPGTLRPGAHAKVLVRVSPQGDVLSANIKRSSGDRRFDDSVISAVYKASPLPIPNDPRLYSYYRDFVFTFDPPG